MNSPSEDISSITSRVKIFDSTSGTSRLILMPSSLSPHPLKELHDILLNCFGNKDDESKIIVGFRDDSNVIYPLSVLIKFGKQFHDRRVSIISFGQSNEYSLDPENRMLQTQESDASIFTEPMAEEAFSLIDMNKDNLIHRGDMLKFLINSIKSVCSDSLDNDSTFMYDSSAIAQRICDSCFEGMGLQNDMYAGRDDFCAWYLAPGENAARDVLIQIIESFQNENSSQEDDYEENLSTNPMTHSLKRDKSQPNLYSDLRYDQSNIGLDDAIAEVKYLTGLDNVSVKAVLQALQSDSQSSTTSNEDDKKIFINRSTFAKRMNSLASITAYNKPDVNNKMSKVTNLINLLFDAFEPNIADDTACLADIACALVPFCGTDEEENILSAFSSLHDIETQGYEGKQPKVNTVTDGAMSNFIFQVSNIFHHISSLAQKKYPSGPDDLSNFLFSHVLENVVRSESKVWSRAEFITGSALAIDLALALLAEDPTIDSEQDDAVIKTVPRSRLVDTNILSEFSGEKITLETSKRILGLQKYLPEFIVSCFGINADAASGYMTFAGYHNSIDDLLSRQYTELSKYDRSIADYLISMFYNLFKDYESSHGRCDVFKLDIAMLLFAGGSPKEKADVLSSVLKNFCELDNHDDCQTISTDYIALCTEPLVEVILALNPGQTDAFTAGDVAYCLAQFSAADLDFPELISCEQLKTWFEVVFRVLDSEHTQDILEGIADEIYQKKNSSIDMVVLREFVNHITDLYNKEFSKIDNDELCIATEEGGNEGSNTLFWDGKQAVDNAPSNDVTLELKNARELLGFAGFSADDLMETIGESISAMGLTRRVWFQVLSYITCLSGLQESKYPLSNQLADKLFDAFVLNFGDIGTSGGVVPYTKFVAGLAILSDSPVEEKIMVGFTLLDEDGDGFIDCQEFEQLVLSVLKVVIVSSEIAAAKVASLPGITIELLASLVTQECLAALEVSVDELLDVDMICDVFNDCMVLTEFQLI